MVEVFTSDEFNEWYQELAIDTQDDVSDAVERLAMLGVALGFPYSSAIRSAKCPLRELRIQSRGHPIRVIYAFDPDRDAYLIIGGEKTGDKRFYDRIIAESEKIWIEYLRTHSGRR